MKLHETPARFLFIVVILVLAAVSLSPAAGAAPVRPPAAPSIEGVHGTANIRGEVKARRHFLSKGG